MSGLHNDDGYGDMIAVVSYDELRMKKDVALLQHRQQAYQWTIALSLGINLDLSWHRHASFRGNIFYQQLLTTNSEPTNGGEQTAHRFSA